MDVLTLSAVTWQVVAWPLVVALLVTVRRRPLPALAVAAVLAEGAVDALVPGRGAAGAVWFAAIPVLLATYPDGRFVPRWFAVPAVAYVVIGVLVVVTDGAVTDAAWFAPWVGLGQLPLLAGQVHRYLRRASTAEREAVRWGLLGVVVTVESFVLLALAGGGTVAASGSWSQALASLAVLPAPVGLAIGLLRPRLADVDRALAAVVVLTVAAPVLGGAYALLGGWPGAVAVGVLAVPAVRAGRWVAARLVHRGRIDPAAALTGLGERLDAQPEARLVPETVLHTVVDSLHLDGAALHGAGLLDATVGTVDGPVTEVPVVYQGEQLAVLAVPPRAGETALTARDREVLDLLAVHAAPALHGARALHELTASHARMLLAREEERRRLRRDLHDDLSPSLAGLRLGAAALARRAAGVDAGLARAAEELQADIRAAVVQTREIAYGLRPPVLDDRGLVAAITGRIGGQQADQLAVHVDAPPGRLDLPAAVDLAALRIVQEAVSNVRRHASATTCTVRLALADDVLAIRVTDDGVGLPSRVRPGLGLTSIRERATELGGTVAFGAADGGGACVDVRLPARVPS